jgi:hypothetical protein
LTFLIKIVFQFIEEKEKEKLAKTDPVKDFQNLHLSDAKKIPTPPVKDQVRICKNALRSRTLAGMLIYNDKTFRRNS